MSQKYAATLAKELKLREGQIAAVASLLDEGGTVPFISRYRKEATGSLDEVQVAAIRDRLEQLAELDKRRAAILESLQERELLTDELKTQIEQADDKAVLEDIYLPYRPKRRTRASMARERGLEPLANALFAQRGADPQQMAKKFISKEKKVPDANAALAGARDILAEQVSENAKIREMMRDMFFQRGRFSSRLARGVKETDEKSATYRDWFSWDEPAGKTPGHRALAMFRGEREGVLSLSLRPAEEDAVWTLKRRIVRGKGADSKEVGKAVEDGYKRLLAPSLENELRAEIKKRADEEAIKVFTANLRELLLAAPLGEKRILGLDPGYRTGAKTVVLDEHGALLHNTTIFPVGSERQRSDAAETVKTLCSKYKIDAVAIGNGTAGRETEQFVRGLNLAADVVLVNESGASIYSASDVARREFPDLDLTVRGAVSIGRRLMDPLAELVKIDPKSIGVGQYQHDVDQAALKKALDDVVESCVNAVGVDLNTASAELLSYVAGLGPALARNVVAYRDESGPFKTRRELLKVKRLGPKAYEQAVGFLRVRGANPLDASAVHPERYPLVKSMAQDAGCTVAELIDSDERRRNIRIESYVSQNVGLPTLKDIMNELAKPGRDPRAEFSAFSFADGVTDIKHLEVGMILPGVVTNVTKFGAFVDVGVHRDGLVHVSQLANRFVSDPNEVVSVGREVSVMVTEVDMQRKRISLSMKEAAQKG